jgi:hypothetical protein
MSTLTAKLPKLSDLKLPEVLDLDEAKKPAFAAAGVVDLYVEQVVGQVKELPAQAKKLQAELTAKLEAARTERAAQLKAVPAQVKELPAGAQKLQAEVIAKVTDKALKAQADVTAYYGTLAARGEKLVAQIRKQPTTTAAIAEGKAAVKKAETTATSAKKTTKAAGKTAQTTAKAVEDAAEKLG